jgi:hypothetical protein
LHAGPVAIGDFRMMARHILEQGEYGFHKPFEK